MSDASRFENRWRIEGTLRVVSPLHIGSGHPCDGPINPETGKPIEVNALARDHRDKPYVPASTLKGNLRAWLTRRLPDQLPDQKVLIDQLFGSLDAGAMGATGSKLLVHDSLCLDTARPRASWPASHSTGPRKPLFPSGYSTRSSCRPASPSRSSSTARISAMARLRSFSPRSRGSTTSMNGQHHVPRLTADRRGLLPAESVRGALRSQAERIVRTFDEKQAPKANLEFRDPNSPWNLIELMFGDAGWASLFRITDGVTEKPVTTIPQEFVAVDRFTGGVSGSSKYNAEYIASPTFTCKLSVDVERLRDVERLQKYAPAVLGLLALTLRDLCEGDVPFGFGTRKGYGACRAEVGGSPATKEDVDAFRKLMNVPETSTALPKIEKVDQALPAPAITSVRPEASEFHNPYHYVPVKKGSRSNDLSRDDFEHRKTAHVTHDRYVDATFSGRLVCKLTTEGPCVFGSTQKPGGGGVTEVQNYTLDGVHAVPATSIKGLLSAVAEAASNSAMRVLHGERSFSYRAEMGESLGAIGMIVKDENDLKLLPLALPHFIGVLGLEGRESEMPTTKAHELFIPVPEGDISKWQHKKLDIKDALERFRRLALERSEASDGETPFHLRGAKWDAVPDLKPGDLVCFTLKPDAQRTADHIAISSIWRKDAKTADHYFSALDPELLPFNPTRTTITLAEQLFGFVEMREEKRKRGERKPGVEPGEGGNPVLALAGRLRCSAGRLPDGKDVKPVNRVILKILASPKPPSPALYFAGRTGTGGHLLKKEFADHTNGMPVPQGRKFYVHDKLNQLARHETANASENANQKNSVRPLPKDTAFYFHIDFDNLSETELALLCYAVRPTENFRHKLGMGRPLGLGKVRLDPVGLFLVHRTARYGHDELNTRRYHAGWVSEPPATWPERYELEKAAPATGGPSPHDLRELFRTEMDADIRHALELLGDPNATMAPVQYPNTTAGESEAFRWWVANDRNPEPDVRQSLDPISPQTHSLPTLRRQ